MRGNCGEFIHGFGVAAGDGDRRFVHGGDRLFAEALQQLLHVEAAGIFPFVDEAPRPRARENAPAAKRPVFFTRRRLQRDHRRLAIPQHAAHAAPARALIPHFAVHDADRVVLDFHLVEKDAG